MSRVYYRVVSGEPLSFCKDFKARWQAKQEQYCAYSESKGGVGFVGFFTCFGGIIFDHGADIPEGLVRNKRRTSDGRDYYKPATRTVAGKALMKEFQALGSRPNNDEFCEAFGIPQSLAYRKTEQCHGALRLTSGGFDTAQVLWAGDEFWIILPDIDAQIESHRTGAYEGYSVEPSSWVLPDGLERSTEARYELSVAHARVALDEAA